MTHKPAPKPDRYKTQALQDAYESGWHQEYDHDSFTLLNRFEWLYDQAAQQARAAGADHDAAEAAGAAAMKAMLTGAADALRALAASR